MFSKSVNGKSRETSCSRLIILSKTKQLPFRDVWPFLRRVYDRFGPRRLVWANFYELLIMKELIPFFTAEDKEWILGRTAHRLYKFPAG